MAKNFQDHLNELLKDQKFREAWEERKRREAAGEFDLPIGELHERFLEEVGDIAAITQAVEQEGPRREFVILCDPKPIRVTLEEFV